MRRIALLLLMISSLLVACVSVSTPKPSPTILPPTETSVPPTPTPSPQLTASEPRTLIVFAAASLMEAFTEIGHTFESSHPGITVAFNFSGSQTLSTQLTQGAVADVFASANHAEMDKVVAAGLIAQDSPKDFLSNRLIVILPGDNPADVLSLMDLARPGLKLVLADKTVPAGKYARQLLDNLSKDPVFGANFSTRVLANVVSNETDVKQVVAKVQLGEADAGIAYLSDSIAVPELKTIDIPANMNVIARYPVATLTHAPQPDLAGEFIAFVLSPDGQAIINKWGFTPVTH